MLSRLPLRLKLTLAFTCVMGVVLGAVGLFVYLRLEASLDEALDQRLHARAGDVAALVRPGDGRTRGSGPRSLTGRGDSFAQVLDEQGRVAAATPGLRAAPLLTAGEAARGLGESLTTERRAQVEPGEREPVRLLATPVEARGRTVVVVVGASLEERQDALRNLGTLLAVGGPVALLLASLAGYGVAAAALRPVEAMRRRAATITEAEPGLRLPVPAARDEISRLGETLNAMLARLEAAFARERTFVADAGHELRTPLAILKAELELALRDGRSPEELRAALGSAAEETDRLAQLADDLLVIARSDEGRLPVRLAPVAADELLDGVRARFARRGADAGRPLEVDAAPGTRFAADPVRLRQALGNLVDNALRHGAGRVRLTAVRGGEGVELHVTDEGAGFPPAFLADAFERFTRADDARARGGTGLGLAIVSAIARAHGGRAAAANRPGGGADVWVEIPDTPAR